MSGITEVVFPEGQKTRLLGTTTGDAYLCKIHANKRLQKGELTGVPESAGAIMFGVVPWPTGQEPCTDCQTTGD